ncbi:MAG: hypothetical protein GPJ54_03460 [Candidatus Heimdallarchaeota archaeon]|nr:hypothetical protein [Candidatus Heimdallarchaeota archaeon]
MSLEVKNNKGREIVGRLIVVVVLALVLEFYLIRFDFFQDDEVRRLTILLVVLYSSASMFNSVGHSQAVIGNRGR